MARLGPKWAKMARFRPKISLWLAPIPGACPRAPYAPKPIRRQHIDTRRRATLFSKLTPFDWDGRALRARCSVTWPLLAPCASPFRAMVLIGAW